MFEIKLNNNNLCYVVYKCFFQSFAQNPYPVFQNQKILGSMITNHHSEITENSSLFQTHLLKNLIEENGGQRPCICHPEEQIQYLCKTDNKLVCQDCLIGGDHHGHEAEKLRSR